MIGLAWDEADDSFVNPSVIVACLFSIVTCITKCLLLADLIGPQYLGSCNKILLFRLWGMSSLDWRLIECQPISDNFFLGSCRVADNLLC